MALSQRKRQRKLERRRTKTRIKRKQAASQVVAGAAGQIALLADCPILDCRVPAGLWKTGMGHVLLSRDAPGEVAYGVFLVDIYCLGVKNVVCGVLPPSDYRDRVIEPLLKRGQMIIEHPAYARKLIEGAVEYAGGFGFAPHRDYRAAKQIFGDIDPHECPESFRFGHHGKPLFIAGPFDTPDRCRKIISMLQFECGPDGYHYVLPVGPNRKLAAVDGNDDPDAIPCQDDELDLIEDR